MSINDLARRYYEAWASQDQEAVRALLDDTLSFSSPQDHFDSAAAFLDVCWRYSDGLTGVRFVKEVYQCAGAFVILEWFNQDGGTFMSGEYLESAGGRINKIIVVNNDPHFYKLPE
jgi:hypothetical protein